MNNVTSLRWSDCTLHPQDRLRHLLAILVAAQTEAENLQYPDIASVIEQLTISVHFLIFDESTFCADLGSNENSVLN